MKRVLDILLSVILGVLLLPVVGVAALAVYCVDPGPVFFVQYREGLNGLPFRMWKLRTMYRASETILERHFRSHPEAREEWDAYLRLAYDPRVLPRIGRFLRRTSIDEIPQLWNVLLGEMSMVGPRPMPTSFAPRFDPDLRSARLSVVPGLTGLWQVSGRSETDITSLQRLDLEYVEHRSLRLDLWILLRTVPAVFSGRGAY